MNMTKKVRVCYFCESWISGGIESFVYNMLSHMDLSDLEVDIVTVYLGKSIFTASLEQIGVHFYELSGSYKHLIQNTQKFCTLLKERHYDVIHIHAFHGVFAYYAFLARQHGVSRVILHSHNTKLRKSKTRFFKMVIHKISRSLFSGFATDFWACSRDAAIFLFPPTLLKKRGYRFIPNGIDITRFHFDPNSRQAVRKQLGWEDCFVIGNVGRLCYQKNQSFLLEVFAQVYAQNPKSRLLLVGRGEALPFLQQKARQLHIDQAVLFYGTSSQVENLFEAMDVFAFPSLFEGLGIVAVEAQAAGLPVVCSEFVPPEASLTSLSICIPLASGAAHWAQALLQYDPPSSSRTSPEDEIRAAGFEVRDVARWLHDQYIFALQSKS